MVTFSAARRGMSEVVCMVSPGRILALPVLILNFVILSLSLLSYSPMANAAVSITGTFSGTFSDNGGTCIAPATAQPQSLFSTFTVTQSGSSFSGSGSVGSSSVTNLSGSIDAQGNVTGGAFTAIEPTSTTTVTFSGTLSGNALTLSGTWVDQGYPSTPGTCTGTFSGTLIRGGSAVITPLTPSSVLTAPMLLNTQVKAISGDLNARIGDVLRGTAIGPRKTASGFMWGGQSGLNAGDGIANYGVWGSYSYSDFENDFASTAFDGHRHNLLGGFDIAPWEKTVFGVAVGYENSDIDTGFNQGNQEADGYTIAAYAGYLLSETWSIDASVGYSNIDSDQFRTDPGTGARITSSPSSDRWFGTLNLNGFKRWENWLIGARIGLLRARNVQESFFESNGTSISEFSSKLGQWSIGGDIAYSLDKFEPFVRLTYENDFSMQKLKTATGPQPSNDNDNFLFGAGLRYFGTNGLTGNLEWNKRLGRDDFDEDTITATLRKDF